MSKLEVRFWGVRGSIPSPGHKTSVHGGNTSCVELRAGGQLIVLDMGSGMRPLGASLGGAAVSGSLFLSHYHWDHIQGLPFFGPVYNPASSFEVFGATRGGREVREILSGQMLPPYFPVTMAALRSQLTFRAIADGDRVEVGAVTVTARELNHPNGALAYRFDYGGRSVVYATDHEHGRSEADDGLVALASGADALIYDAMYTPEEYAGENGRPGKVGWGHSTWIEAAAIARRAGIGTLVLFHHEPSRSDEALEEIEGKARRLHPATVAAREGQSLEF
jgi:phosphoribosyl 1,2-cyclic phosphodiesterase